MIIIIIIIITIISIIVKCNLYTFDRGLTVNIFSLYVSGQKDIFPRCETCFYIVPPPVYLLSVYIYIFHSVPMDPYYK